MENDMNMADQERQDFERKVESLSNMSVSAESSPVIAANLSNMGTKIIVSPEKTVYLAGPIAGSGYDTVTGWREEAVSELWPIKVMSPMRAKQHFKGQVLDVHDYELKGQYEVAISSDKGIVTRDRNDVTTCDLVLMNLLGAKRVSIGTMVELGWADAARIPLVLVMEEENVHNHPFVRNIPGFWVDNLADAYKLVKAILLP